MNKKATKKIQPKTMKKQIIQSAIKKFAKDGFSDASMDDIAKSAKVSKGLLFYHFQSKEELFFQSLSESIDSMLNSGYKLCESGDLGLFQKRENMLQDLEKYYDLVIRKEEQALERVWLDGMLESKKNPKLKKLLIKREDELNKLGVIVFKAGRKTSGMLKEYNDSELAEFARGLLALYKGIMLEKSMGKNSQQIKKQWVRTVYAVFTSKK